MSKRRGFTLTEVLVVILLTTLVLAMVGGTLVFLTQSSGTLIHKGEELTLTQSIEDYLRGLVKEIDGEEPIIELNEICVKDESGNTPVYLSDGNLYFNNEIAFEDTGLSSFSIDTYQGEEGKYFVRCTMTYKSKAEYSFILGVVTQ